MVKYAKRIKHNSISKRTLYLTVNKIWTKNVLTVLNFYFIYFIDRVIILFWKKNRAIAVDIHEIKII